MAFIADEDDAACYQAALAFVDAFPASAAYADEPESLVLDPLLRGCDNAGEGGGVVVELLLPLEEEETLTRDAIVGDEALHSISTTGEAATTLAAGYAPPLASVLSVSPPQQQVAQLQNAPTKKKRQFAWNPNKARDERRDELIYLRKKVAELNAKLSEIKANKTLQIGAGEASAMEPSALSDYPTEEESMLQMSSALSHPGHPLRLQQETHPAVRGVWEDIARRQSEARARAERENIRLKLVLEDQLKIAKSWEKVLNRKATTHDMDKYVDVTRVYPKYPPTADRADAEVFEDLLAGIARSYAEIDAVFEANGLAHIESAYSDARIRSAGSGRRGMSLEICSSKVLPFDMHSTATAAWHHFIFGKEKVPSRFYDFSFTKNVDITEDTIVESFNVELHAKNTTAYLRVKKALRRYVEEERIVIVFRTLFYPVELAEEPMSGVCFRVSGYIVIKRPRTIPGTFSLLQLCYKYTPIVGTDHPKVGAMTEFMMRATEANFTASHQLIENVLLAQARNKLGV